MYNNVIMKPMTLYANLNYLFRAGEVVSGWKLLLCKPNDLSSIPGSHGERQEVTLESRLLASTLK